MKVLLHVNYVEGPGDCLERLFALASRAGCDGVELRWKYRFQDRTQEEYCALVADLKQRYPEMEIVFGGNIPFCRGEHPAPAGSARGGAGDAEGSRKQPDRRPRPCTARPQ